MTYIHRKHVHFTVIDFIMMSRQLISQGIQYNNLVLIFLPLKCLCLLRSHPLITSAKNDWFSNPFPNPQLRSTTVQIEITPLSNVDSGRPNFSLIAPSHPCSLLHGNFSLCRNSVVCILCYIFRTAWNFLFKFEALIKVLIKSC